MADYADWANAQGIDPRSLHPDDLAISIEEWEDLHFATEEAQS